MRAPLLRASPPRRARPLVLGLIAAGLVLGLGRCDLTEPVDRDELVVEAFVETGRPLPPVRLRRVLPLTAPADTAPARGADVRLTLGDTTVPYEEAQPGRYEPEGGRGSWTVPSRVPLSLTVRWQGETATARGRTPPPIRIREVCVRVPDEPVAAILVDSLRRDSLDIPAEEGFLYPIEVTTKWTTDNLTPPDTASWVRAELQPTAQFSSTVVSFFLQPAEVRREQTFDPATNRTGRRWTGVYAFPVDSARAPLPRHRVATTLVRGDTAFAAFATSRTDPDRREPVSNVQGAVGIATGIALDSLGRPVGPEASGCTVVNPASRPGVSHP
jgi:hypothetical protein